MACARGCCESPRDHYLSVSISASACPSREGGRYAKRVNDTEKRWEKDIPAYKAMRKDGLQPPRVDGAAELQAKAESRIEVETGQAMSKKQREAYSHITGDTA